VRGQDRVLVLRSRHRPERALGLVNQARVNRVHQPAVYRAGCLPEDGQDRERDEPTTGSAQSQPRATPPTPSSTARGEPVGAGVQPIGDKGRGADPAPGPDPVTGREFVPSEPGQRAGRHLRSGC
jgi:hypothetical protein